LSFVDTLFFVVVLNQLWLYCAYIGDTLQSLLKIVSTCNELIHVSIDDLYFAKHTLVGDTLHTQIGEYLIVWITESWLKDPTIEQLGKI